MPAAVTFCTLASGSSGNAAFFANPEGCLLVDAGISGTRLAAGLAAIGVAPHTPAGILLTHSHVDHIRSAGIAARKFGLPLFMTPGTAGAVRPLLRGGERCHHIDAAQPFRLGGFVVTPEPTPHDAPGAICYVLEYGGVRVGIFTDMGHLFDGAKRLLPTLDGVILESNHDPALLAACSRPAWTKVRIAGERGHLSNEDAATLIRDHASPRLRVIVLAHLSRENNRPALALECHAAIAADFHAAHGPLVEVAPPSGSSRLFALHPHTEHDPGTQGCAVCG